MRRQKISGSWYEKEWKAMGGQFYLKTGGVPHLKIMEGQFFGNPRSPRLAMEVGRHYGWAFLSMVRAPRTFQKKMKMMWMMLQGGGMSAAGSKMTQSRWRERGWEGTWQRSTCFPNVANCSTPAWSKFNPFALMYFAMCQNLCRKCNEIHFALFQKQQKMWLVICQKVAKCIMTLPFWQLLHLRRSNAHIPCSTCLATIELKIYSSLGFRKIVRFTISFSSTCFDDFSKMCVGKVASARSSRWSAVCWESLQENGSIFLQWGIPIICSTFYATVKLVKTDIWGKFVCFSAEVFEVWFP